MSPPPPRAQVSHELPHPVFPTVRGAFAHWEILRRIFQDVSRLYRLRDTFIVQLIEITGVTGSDLRVLETVQDKWVQNELVTGLHRSFLAIYAVLLNAHQFAGYPDALLQDVASQCALLRESLWQLEHSELADDQRWASRVATSLRQQRQIAADAAFARTLDQTARQIAADATFARSLVEPPGGGVPV